MGGWPESSFVVQVKYSLSVEAVVVKEQLEALINQMVERGILYDEALTEFEKKFIRKVLERNRWNQCKTARALGIHRNTLSKKISTYKLHV
jgi:DNA-binding protein Fis